MDLKDKVVLITGASSGIGRALAKELAGRGAKVALLARREAELKALAKEIGGNALALPADVTAPAQVKAAVEQAAAYFGRLDALVNNAGQGYFGSIEKMDMAALDTMLKINVHGLVQTTQAALPQLKKTRGMIVNVSSGLSKRALPFLSAYAGSKSMVNAISDGMRMELRLYGIKVLTYCPPEVETGFDKRAITEPGLERAGGERRKASAEAIAADIARAMAAEKREVVRGKSLMFMNLLAPRLADNIFYKAMVVKMAGDGLEPGGRITAAKLKELLAEGKTTLIDVREPGEFRSGHIRGAVSVPLGQLGSRLGTLPRDRPVVAVCLSGRRSAAAVKQLRDAGFEQIYNLQGGMQAWPYEVER